MEAPRCIEALERYYTRVFVYGLRSIFDPTAEYQWPATVRSKTVFCGYIARSVDKVLSKAARQQICGPGERLVVVTIGGGSDGNEIVDTYLRALPHILRQVSVKSLVILGPEMDPAEASRLRRTCDRRGIVVMDFCADPMPYLDAADLVVSMAGYNTISEILTLDKKAIVIPRTYPRREQLIRARRLQEFGLLRTIEPDQLTRDRLAAEVQDALLGTDAPVTTRLEFTGLDRLTLEMHALLATDPCGTLSRAEARVVYGDYQMDERFPLSPGRVGYVVKRYPRFSETFVVSEILAHEEAGLDLDIFSLYPSNDSHFQESIARVRAPVTYIPGDGLRASDFWAGVQQASNCLPEVCASLTRRAAPRRATCIRHSCWHLTRAASTFSTSTRTLRPWQRRSCV